MIKDEKIVEDELKKLKDFAIETPQKKRNPVQRQSLNYCVLITYTVTYTDYYKSKLEIIYTEVKKKWQEKWDEAPVPLLLILIDFEYSKEYASRRKFRNVRISKFDGKNAEKEFRTFPALPWELAGTRWEQLK